GLGGGRAVVAAVLFFSSRRRHTSFSRDWSSDVCSSDLGHQCIQQSADAGEGGGYGLRAQRVQRFVGEVDGGFYLHAYAQERVGRSEERRVGTERRSRWGPDHGRGTRRGRRTAPGGTARG